MLWFFEDHLPFCDPNNYNNFGVIQVPIDNIGVPRLSNLVKICSTGKYSRISKSIYL